MNSKEEQAAAQDFPNTSSNLEAGPDIAHKTKKEYSKPVLILLSRSGRIEGAKISQSIAETVTSTPPRGVGTS